MAIYAVGDLQGCLSPLLIGLDRLQFNRENDEIWFVGDLVNRGPQSLQTLRYVKSLGDCAKVVLGNHDLHLLALAHGQGRGQHRDLDPIIEAPDATDLIEWLRHQPLMIRNKELHLTMVHAGIYPWWSIKEAHGYAKEVEEVLRGDQAKKFFKRMYGKRPAQWSKDLEGWARYRFITNAFTRMRFCTRKGALNFSHKSPPGRQPKQIVPWYEIRPRPRKNWRIAFGHWSSAGHWFDGNHVALDSGCVWGETMTFARLDQRRISTLKVPCGVAN